MRLNERLMGLLEETYPALGELNRLAPIIRAINSKGISCLPERGRARFLLKLKTLAKAANEEYDNLLSVASFAGKSVAQILELTDERRQSMELTRDEVSELLSR